MHSIAEQRVGTIVYIVNAIHYGINDTCIAAAWNLLPPIPSVIQAVRMEQDRMLQNPDERFPSLINLDAISIRAARYSGQKMDQQACCEDAIRALLRMEEKLKSMANIQEQALFAVFDFCSNCGIPAFPFIDKKNRCLYCTDTTRVTGARTCMNHEGILGCMQCCILTAWCRGKGMLAASGISS